MSTYFGKSNDSISNQCDGSGHETPDPSILEDAFEKQFLSTARFFFQSYTEPDGHAWMDAFWRAEREFAVPYGATIAQAIVIVINELRSSRARGFAYQNPYCTNCSAFMTNEERYLVLSLRAIRKGNRTAASTNALLLCESEDTSRFLAALQRLVAILEMMTKHHGNQTEEIVG